MSPTKLLILAAALMGLLVAPSVGAEEEIDTTQAAELPIAVAAFDTPDAGEGTVAEQSEESPQGDSAPAAMADSEDAAEALSIETFEGDAVEPPAAPAELEAANGDEMDMPAGFAGDAAPIEGEIDAMAEVPASLDGDALPDAPDPMADAEELLEERPALGAIGYDSKGRRGRVHVVQPSDTLWDISETYLGTPWVWPSIWDDNEQVVNPHRIEPGDRIWITPNEMRRITAEEAAALLANGPPEPAAANEFPVAVEDIEVPLEPEAAPEIPIVPEERPTFVVSSRESTGMITVEQLRGAATIVGRIPTRVLLSQEDMVYLGLGESEAEVGDQLTIFRTREQVFDPDTGKVLGYHVEVLGWVEIEESFPETSLARIRMSNGDVEMGDRLVPRQPLPAKISVMESPEGVEGKISFFPNNRVLMSYNDFVYINRGTEDGLEVGSPLEVYRPGYPAREPVREQDVQVPDHVIAQLLVVRAHTEASVALVTHTETELAMGDRVRARAD